MQGSHILPDLSQTLPRWRSFSYDTKDSTSVKREDYDFTSALVDDVAGMKIGIPRDYFGEGLDPEVKAAVLQAAEELKKKGAIVESFVS